MIVKTISPIFAASDLEDWDCVQGYGDTIDKVTVANTVQFRTTKTKTILAPCAGNLSTIPPGSGLHNGLQPTESNGRAPIPKSATLYLHINNFQSLKGLGKLVGFVFVDVDVSSMQAELGLSDKHLRKLYFGEKRVAVQKGYPLFGPSKTTKDQYQFEFSALNENGPIDAKTVYSLVAELSDASTNFLYMLKGRWPIEDLKSKADTIKAFSKKVYPMPVILAAAKKMSLDDSSKQWAIIRENQKGLWLQMLKKRAGYAEKKSDVPPFFFDMIDWKNVFCLEALVEFYVNLGPSKEEMKTAKNARLALHAEDYNTPWKRGAKQRDKIDPKYRSVNFSDICGARATQKGVLDSTKATLYLADKPDLSQVTVNHDMIYLNVTLSGNDRQIACLITGVDTSAFIIEIELPKNTSKLQKGELKWRIRLKPQLVLVDAFGPRATGLEASCESRNTVRLDDCSDQNFDRINSYFDTIYFEQDSRKREINEARPLKTYRIMNKLDENKEVVLDAPPSFGGKSKWLLQAGIGKNMPPLFYEFSNRRGYDHFDGVMFVVYGGRIEAHYRWSSYTSRSFGANRWQWRSSVLGNRRYDVFNKVSSPRKCHHNYCFSVVDEGKQWRDDYVRYARFYFETNVTADYAPPPRNAPSTRNLSGKVGIRIHWSRTRRRMAACGSRRSAKNSAGCIVSPALESFRAKLIELYQRDFKALEGDENAYFNTISALIDHYASERHFTSDRRISEWRSVPGRVSKRTAIRTALWLIRPDERPVG